MSSSADCFGGAVDDGAEQLGVLCVRLSLAADPDVTAPRDERQGDDDGEDGGEAGAEAGPMEVDKRETVVGLVQVHIG